MALVDRDYVGAERRRIVNVIASIAAADMWTELRGRNASAAADPRGVFQEVVFDDLTRLRETDIHRRFSVRVVSSPPHGVQTVGPTHDVDVLLRIQVGRYVGGGARLPFPASPPLADEVSAQDCVRIVQKLTDPANRSAGLTGPIYTGLPTEARRVIVAVTEGPRVVLDETPSQGGRQVWQIDVRSWIRLWSEPS